MQAKVKICGIKSLDDAMWAANLGADFIGLNFCKESPRFVSLPQAAKIKKNLPGFIKVVGVFVNPGEAEIDAVLKKVALWGVQLHGEESPESITVLKTKYPDLKVIKAFRIKQGEALPDLTAYKESAEYFLFDTFSETLSGGTGESFDWAVIEDLRQYGKDFFLAGGLTPENVSAAIEKTKPFAVDTASGVEKAPAKKDYELLKKFIFEVKRTVF